jgi:NSS family neurotransmitter:Na+ symporter
LSRENFRSRLGFILVSAGCAIGIGNVWKFPYVTGVNGGGVFVLFYIISLVIMGVPILTMELAVGRASRKSAVLGYKALEPKGSRWHIHGWLCVIGCCLLMMYYTTVSGWMLGYCFKFASGTFSGMQPSDVDTVWTDMLANPGEMTLYMVIIVLAGFIVCSFGLQKGLERISKWMMICLLALIVILAINSLTLDGAMEGVKFYLVPDFERAAEVGIGNVIVAAMNQSFFTLSLGIAAMEIFGSYMSDANRLPGEAVRICCLDTFVALMSGMIIFPACFSFGLEPGQGPSLIFMTLPRVFVSMTGGRLGRPVLPVPDLRQLHHGAGGVREHYGQLHGQLRLVPEKSHHRLRNLHPLGQHALCAGLQSLVFRGVPAQRRHRPDPGYRGLPGEQSAAAHRLPDLSAVLRQQVGLGL